MVETGSIWPESDAVTVMRPLPALRLQRAKYIASFTGALDEADDVYPTDGADRVTNCQP